VITNLRIDEQLQNIIPPLSKEEYQILEASILQDGVREPIYTWGNTIIDGHNRYSICEKHGIEPPTEELHFKNRTEALVWIIDNQKGRRNLTKQAWLDLGFKRAELLKPKAEANKASAARKARAAKAGNESLLSQESDTTEPVDTLQQAADYAGVSRDTAAKYKKVNESDNKEVKEKVRTGELSINRGYEEVRRPHVINNSGENEWYTPTEYIEAAREVLGEITCDPASSELANRNIKAQIYFTKDDDGLSQKWSGKVWLNPPYSKDLITRFSRAAAEKYQSGEIDAACLLVNNATETLWFQELIGVASAVCFPRGRVKYLDRTGKPANTPLQGQAIVYLGTEPEDFRMIFSGFGRVLWVAT
jgi:ParB family chromosome partitioning protein